MPLNQELTTSIEARIQSEVATFLSLKSTLLGLQQSRDQTVASKATQLLGTQTALEDQLKDVLQKIDNIKNGAYSIGDITSASAFALSMEKQIRDVKSLNAGRAISTMDPLKVFAMLAVLGIGGAILYGVSRR